MKKMDKKHCKHLVSAVFVAFMLFLAAGSDDSGNRSSSISNRSSSISTGKYTIRRDSIVGCCSKDTYKKLTRYAVEKDKTAFTNLLMAGVLTGDCTMFTLGETVFVEEVSLLSGLIKVRRKGETTEYWTQIKPYTLIKKIQISTIIHQLCGISSKATLCQACQYGASHLMMRWLLDRDIIACGAQANGVFGFQPRCGDRLGWDVVRCRLAGSNQSHQRSLTWFRRSKHTTRDKV